jgi:hypothetical protein
VNYGYALRNSTGLVVDVLDLEKGESVKRYGPEDFVTLGKRLSWGAAISPDGQYLFTTDGNEKIIRLKLYGGEVVLEESSPPIIQGAFQDLFISPDGAYVCAPSGGGNYLLDGPRGVTYATYIFPASNLQKPQAVLRQGAYPRVVGFDSRAGLVYAHNSDHALLVFNQHGLLLKKHTVPGVSVSELRQILAHPEGRKLLLVSGKALRENESTPIRYVELPSNRDGSNSAEAR